MMTYVHTRIFYIHTLLLYVLYLLVRSTPKKLLMLTLQNQQHHHQQQRQQQQQTAKGSTKHFPSPKRDERRKYAFVKPRINAIIFFR